MDLPLLTPGVIVGHANTELADWEGEIAPDQRGRSGELGYVRVIWRAGSIDGNGREPLPAGPRRGVWHSPADLTVKGACPDCARPAHFIRRGNLWERAEGWHHDSRVDSMTCWARQGRI